MFVQPMPVSQTPTSPIPHAVSSAEYHADTAGYKWYRNMKALSAYLGLEFADAEIP